MAADKPESLEPAQSSAERKPEKRKTWQENLLPLMSGLLVGLSIFFMLATFIQLAYLYRSMQQFPPLEIGAPLPESLNSAESSFDARLRARQLEILARMEAYVIEHRYHHAVIALMSGLWVRYLGFLTGMILALVGASFVLGRLREPVTELISKGGGLDISLRSASPGLILVVLGTLLMFTTIVDEDQYGVFDRPAYLSVQSGGIAIPDETPQPTPTFYVPEELMPTEGAP